MRNILTTLSGCVLAVLLLSVNAWAQENITISGRVTDASTGEALIGVSIRIKETNGGTSTDANGAFRITAPSNGTLVSTYIGFETLETRINNRTTININLKASTQSLEQVVVVGYGTQRKKDVTGAISSVKAEDIANRSVLSPTQALQGKAAGVQVSSNSGAPGSTPSVRIRGVGTIGNSNPLYVVDGVFVDDINYLNSSDIASFEILKDASSLAIYGVRGANGVILVTTKAGRSGKASISVESYYGVTDVAKEIKMANAEQYQLLTAEAIRNSDPNATIPPSLTNPATTSTDWFDQVLRTGAIQNHQVSISGASEKVTYNVSAGYSKEKGIVNGTSFERLNIRANNEYKPFTSFKFGHSLAFSTSKTANQPGSIVQNAYLSAPIYSPTNADGTFNSPPGAINNVANPVAQLFYNDDWDKGNRFVGNFFGELTFLKDFKFRSSFSADLNYQNGRVYIPQYTVSSLQRKDVSELTINKDQFTNLLWENTLSYTKELNKIHRINALVGITSQTQRAEYTGATALNVPAYSEDVKYLNTGTDQTASGSANEYAYLSYLFRLNYSLLDRYLLTLSMRSDGSSRFPQDNRYSFFPAIGLGWRISEESFLKDVEWLDNLKLRASYGKLGNTNIPDYLYLARITSRIGPNDPTTNLGAIFGTTPTLNQGATEINTNTSNLLWEKVNQLDIGFEMGFFKNRLTFEADYYRRETTDAVVQVNAPQGGGTLTVNAGNILNKGFEFTAGWSETIGDDWKYSLNGNFTTVKNEVMSLGNGGRPIFSGSLNNGTTATITQVGLPIASFWGYQVEGVFQNQAEVSGSAQPDARPGDLVYRDVNQDGVIDLNNDRVDLGSSIPKIIYALNMNVGYKNVDLSLDLQGVGGNKIYNGKKAVRVGNENFEADRLNRWTGEGSSNTDPRLTNSVVPISSYYVENGSFLRVRTLQLGYTLPKSLLERLNVSSVRLYVNALNPFTFTNYSGFSPEVGSGLSGAQNPGQVVDNSNNPDLARGVDYSIIPVTRTFTFGINIGI